MPGGWTVGPSLSAPQDVGTVINSSQTGLSTVSCGTAFTKGAWAQAIASTTGDTAWCFIEWTKGYSAPTSSAIDIGIGPAGSEVAIVQNLLNQAYVNQSAQYLFPLNIKAGTRVAVRMAAESVNSVYYRMTLFGDTMMNGLGSASAVDTYGFNPSTNQGTTLDPGATANAYGAWTQITANTAAGIMGLFFTFDTQNRTTGGSQGNDYLIDLAIGASGSEQIIMPSYWTRLFTNSTQLELVQSPFWPMRIPAGTRIAARARSDYATSPDRTIGITLYGVRR